MVHGVDDDVVLAGLEVGRGVVVLGEAGSRVLLADDELLAAAEAVLAAAAVACHLVGAVARGQRRAAVAPARLGARARRVAQRARLPELEARHRPQDRDVDRDDAHDGLAHAPPVDVERRRVRAEGQDHADDGGRDDEETRAEE